MIRIGWPHKGIFPLSSRPRWRRECHFRFYNPNIWSNYEPDIHTLELVICVMTQTN